MLPTTRCLNSDGNVLIAEGCADKDEAIWLAQHLAESLQGGAAAISIVPPVGERDAGWVVMVLSRQQVRALARPVRVGSKATRGSLATAEHAEVAP